MAREGRWCLGETRRSRPYNPDKHSRTANNERDAQPSEKCPFRLVQNESHTRGGRQEGDEDHRASIALGDGDPTHDAHNCQLRPSRLERIRKLAAGYRGRKRSDH